MVAVPGKHQGEAAGTASPALAAPVAGSIPRLSAYLIDSIALVVVLLVSFAIAGVYLLLADKQSDGDPADSAYYWFTAIILGGSLVLWSVTNLFLLHARGQTVGMYVMAIRVADEFGRRPSFKMLAQRWFGLSPSLFHPLMLLPWLLLVFLLASLDVHPAVLGLGLTFALLCLVAPSVAVLTMLIDPRHRTLHDRLSGTVVFQVEA